MHQDDCLSNFYKDYMSSLSTIYHYASLALQRNFLLVCFLLQLSWKDISSLAYKRIPPPFESRSNLYVVLKPSIKNWLWGKMSSIFVSEIISISILSLIWSLRPTLYCKIFAELNLIKGNAQFLQKVTFEPLIDFKQNHYGNWKCY